MSSTSPSGPASTSTPRRCSAAMAAASRSASATLSDAVRAGLLEQQLPARRSREAHDLELAAALDHVERLRADRAGGADYQDPAHPTESRERSRSAQPEEIRHGAHEPRVLLVEGVDVRRLHAERPPDLAAAPGSARRAPSGSRRNRGHDVVRLEAHVAGQERHRRRAGSARAGRDQRAPSDRASRRGRRSRHRPRPRGCRRRAIRTATAPRPPNAPWSSSTATSKARQPVGAVGEALPHGADQAELARAALEHGAPAAPRRPRRDGGAHQQPGIEAAVLERARAPVGVDLEQPGAVVVRRRGGQHRACGSHDAGSRARRGRRSGRPRAPRTSPRPPRSAAPWRGTRPRA